MTIPRDAFPFMRHRTLAQVMRTEELIAEFAIGNHKLTNVERGELGALLTKARRHNPPGYVPA